MWGRQYAEKGEIDAALLAQIGTLMIPEDMYARIANGEQKEVTMEDKRFEVVSQEGSGFSYLRAILVDKETGVNYLFVQSGYAGGLTPLLDADGKPVVTKKDN